MQQRNRVTSHTLLAATLWILAAPALAQELFSLQDARGDDDGTGDLIYPTRDDLHKGDLDLVSVSADRRSDGVSFVVELALPIANPRGRVTELGQTPMDRIARNGFYTFNVDIYIDKDRVAGSGQVGTVPGRGVTVDRQFAWEKAVVRPRRPRWPS